MRAEQQLQAVGEQGPDVRLGAAAVTAVHSGKRPGKAPVRRLALLRPVSALAENLFPLKTITFISRRESAFLKSPPGGRE